MTSAWTATDDCASGTPQSDKIGGVAPYAASYAYDATGNRTKETKTRLGRRGRIRPHLHLPGGGRQAAARAPGRRGGRVRLRRGGQHHQAQGRHLGPEPGLGRRGQPGVGDGGGQDDLVRVRRGRRAAAPQDHDRRHPVRRRHGAALRLRQGRGRADPLLHHQRRGHRGPHAGQPGLLPGQRPSGHRRRPRSNAGTAAAGHQEDDAVRRGPGIGATVVARAARFRRRRRTTRRPGWSTSAPASTTPRTAASCRSTPSSTRRTRSSSTPTPTPTTAPSA